MAKGATRDIHPADDYQYVAAAGATTLNKVSRHIIVNGATGAEVLYGWKVGAAAESQIAADISKGQEFPVQITKIGATTDCTKMTVLF